MAMTSGEPGALLVSVRVPENVLADAGVKPRAKAEEAAGAMESGTVRPVSVKPVPASVAWVMLRVDVPEFLMVKAREPLEPTMTLPKLALAGETEICGWIPVPLTEIVAGELVALLTMLRLPAALPAEVGAKFTVMGMV